MTTYRAMYRPATAHSFETRSTNRARVSQKMDRSQWALGFTGAVLALKDYQDSTAYKWERASKVLEVAGNGKYARVIRLTAEGEWGSPHWVNTSTWYRACDTVREYRLERQLSELTATTEREVMAATHSVDQKLSLLSQNTVTRALVHAYSNDYCSETAVALISAGHKMPDVTLDLQVSLSVSVTLDGNSNYYPLRQLFGETGGDVEGASHISGVEQHDKVAELVREQIESGEVDYYYMNIDHTGTSIDWGQPVLRQVPTSQAQAEVLS